MAESLRGAVPYSEVFDYASASLHNDPMLYPVERPADSYLTDGLNVKAVELEPLYGSLNFYTYDATIKRIPLDTQLQKYNAAPMSDRVPVLAFGANMAPGSLRSKFLKVGRPDALVVPTIYATKPGSDVVWSSAPGMNGNHVAVLYSGEETTDITVQVGINFLTREQLMIMHATELNYDLQSTELWVNGIRVPAYYYAGKDEIAMKDGRPIAVAPIPASGRSLPEATATEMLTDLLSNDEFIEALLQINPELSRPSTAADYVGYIASLKPSAESRTPKLDFRRSAARIVAALGMSKTINSESDDKLSWANPSTLATYSEIRRGITHHALHVLPNSELPISEWPDRAARDKVLHGIAEHFHRHYPMNQR